jgi:uncharacterized Fe-S radical SAM superfamily protein PflX
MAADDPFSNNDPLNKKDLTFEDIKRQSTLCQKRPSIARHRKQAVSGTCQCKSQAEDVTG